MAEKNESNEEVEIAEGKPKTCFVIMPISDVDGYETGHFKRVYEHIIKPACENAGFTPLRADDINTTNHIIIDILKRIIEAEMAICDLSSRNPNVLYELGIRQAFNLPITLIKDERTSRIFDIQTLRDVPYSSSLRIDTIEQVVPTVADALRSTYENKDDSINSIIQLLGIEAAKITKTEVSEDTGLLLNAINSLGKRISKIEDRSIPNLFGSNYSFGNDNELTESDLVRSVNLTFRSGITDQEVNKIIRYIEKGHPYVFTSVGDIYNSKNPNMDIGFDKPISTLEWNEMAKELKAIAPHIKSWTTTSFIKIV